MDAKSDHQPNPIDFILDRFIEHYQTYSDVFIQALKHPWNPMLDEQLKNKIDEIEDSDLKADMESISRYRKENGETPHSVEFLH